ncbi:hypothetical protein IWX47DRAFT_888522 [Phyllosticta citricarpa]
MSWILSGLYHIAVISGSSSGIGASIARELSARGASIVVNYPFAQLSEEAHKVAESLQTPSIAVEADMSSIDGPAKLVGSAVGKFGRIEIVVNNAALAVNAQLGELPLDHWDKLVNLNGRGVFLLSGRIVNVGMVDSFTRCWSKEIPPKYGCTVYAEGFLAAGEEAIRFLQPTIDATPVGRRMADPSEIAYAVAFLCEERALWINGEYLSANRSKIQVDDGKEKQKSEYLSVRYPDIGVLSPADDATATAATNQKW